MSHTQYQTMCHEVLDNLTWYRPISPTNITGFVNKFRELCMGAFWQGLIDKDTLNYLVPKHLHTPTFYTLPKTHKNLSQPPGRPIVSDIGSLTDNASKFVDSFLLPHVSGLPSYIRDTSDLLRHIEGIQIPRDALLVAIDVESLYSSIPHEKGIATARSFLMEQEDTSWPLNEFILQLLTFILTQNFFIFEDQHYLPIQGVAMGTSCAPSYANLFLGAWKRYIFSDDQIFNLFRIDTLLVQIYQWLICGLDWPTIFIASIYWGHQCQHHELAFHGQLGQYTDPLSWYLDC